MSMVSYYTPAAMYRHPHQAAAAAAAAAAQTGAAFHHHAANGMHPHSWYAGGYHHHQAGGAQVPAAPPAASYCMQEEQPMWHQHQHAHPAAVVAFHAADAFGAHDFGVQHHHQALELPGSQLPSPPITVSGSELSSPGGGGGGSVSPPHSAAKARPAPARSPYDWMTKPSYQNQPNPEPMKPLLLEDIVGHDLQSADDASENGKTRTRDKYRVVYSEFQRIELEKEFTLNNKYITIRRKTELSANLGLSERQIKIWFQNRRAKERKQLKKRLEETGKDDASAGLHLQQYEHKMAQMQLQNQFGGQLGMPPTGGHHHPHPHHQATPPPHLQPQQQRAHPMMSLSPPNAHRMTALMDAEYDVKMEPVMKYERSPGPQQALTVV